jgi:hypothetical protein
MQVLLGMLGMGGLRTLDKIKGVAAKWKVTGKNRLS